MEKTGFFVTVTDWTDTEYGATTRILVDSQTEVVLAGYSQAELHRMQHNLHWKYHPSCMSAAIVFEIVHGVSHFYMYKHIARTN